MLPIWLPLCREVKILRQLESSRADISVSLRNTTVDICFHLGFEHYLKN